MVNPGAIPITTPALSIIIAAYNSWGPLSVCLQSLAGQSEAPGFEVVVVDDGSKETAPDYILDWTSRFPLTIIRQAHQGISVARNLGIKNSRGAVLVFVDADCRLQSSCLAVLASGIREKPKSDYFQLRIGGDRSNLVGRAEELRLLTIQKHLLQSDGRIRYLNTAGFAIRRTRADIPEDVFDPTAIRAEDTLLMANLMQSDELPWFVGDAVVQHAIPLSLLACFVKDIRSAYLERSAYKAIAAEGVKFRVSHRERLGILRSMWKNSAQRSIGRLTWFVVVIRQLLRLIMLLLTDAPALPRTSRASAKSP